MYVTCVCEKNAYYADAGFCAIEVLLGLKWKREKFPNILYLYYYLSFCSLITQISMLKYANINTKMNFILIQLVSYR